MFLIIYFLGPVLVIHCNMYQQINNYLVISIFFPDYLISTTFYEIMVEEEHPENGGSADQENGMQSPVVPGSSSRTRTAASVFRSLSSHHSSGDTDEALAAMENVCHFRFG